MIVNMLVELDGRSFENEHEAEQLAAVGARLEHHEGATEEESAWIARTFRGRWADEARAGWNWFAKDAAGATVGFATYEQREIHWWWLEGWLRQRDVGIFGPMGVERNLRGKNVGCILARRALSSIQGLGFRRALIPAVGPIRFYERCCGARVVERLARPK